MIRAPYESPVITPHRPDVVNHFGRAASVEPVTQIDGVSVRDLAAGYGSPLFVFSERTIREQTRKVREMFRSRHPRTRFAWSYKTNYLDAICAIFHEEGWDAEVVSDLEYAMARRLGIPGDRIICNGAYKPRAWCELAAQEGALIQIDHMDELAVLAEIARGRREPLEVALRVNVYIEALGLPWERFGFTLENGEALDAAVRLQELPQLKLAGLHCHAGTFLTQPEIYATLVRKLAGLARDIEPLTGRPLRFLNLGGGFPSNNSLTGDYSAAPPDLEAFADAICTALREEFDDPPELILESGRALIDAAGTLIATIGTRTRFCPHKRHGVRPRRRLCTGRSA
jgi:diaminopimelate decarboxylase